MPAPFSAIRYTGTNPNGAGNTVLFSTVDAGWSPHLTSEVGIHRVLFNVQTTDNTGSAFILQKSRDRGVTWRQVSSTAAAAPTTNNSFDVVVEGLPDWRVIWSNGAINQVIFEADGALIDSRNPTT